MSTTIVIDGKEFVQHLYEKCVKEQFEMFSYTANDNKHVYLSKYYIMMDLILRMLALYRDLINATNKKVKRVYIKWYNDYDIHVDEQLYSIVEESDTHMHKTTTETCLQQVSKLLGDACDKIHYLDMDVYSNVEQFLIKYGHKTSNFNTLVRKCRDISKREEYDTEIKHQLTSVLAPFQMRLTQKELNSCIQMFFGFLVYSNENERVILYTMPKDLTDLDLFHYIVLKHKSKHVHYLTHNSMLQHFIAHKFVTYQYYNFNSIPILNEQMSVYRDYQLVLKYGLRLKSKTTFMTPLKKLPSTLPAIQCVTPAFMTLLTLFEELDKKYCNTLMLINLYAMHAIQYEPQSLYNTKTFKSPQTDDFENYDLPMMTFVHAYNYIRNLLRWFNIQYKFCIE